MPCSIVGKQAPVLDTDGLSVNELTGNVATNCDDVSVAKVSAQAGTAEPWATVHYDQWMCVTSGRLVLQQEGVPDLEVQAGQTVHITRGTRFRSFFPVPTELIPVCLPAFKPERCTADGSWRAKLSSASPAPLAPVRVEVCFDDEGPAQEQKWITARRFAVVAVCAAVTTMATFHWSRHSAMHIGAIFAAAVITYAASAALLAAAVSRKATQASSREVSKPVANTIAQPQITSSPAPPPPPPDSVVPQFGELTNHQQLALEQMKSLVREELRTESAAGALPGDPELLAYLKLSKWSAAKAIVQYREAREWRQQVGKVTIADVAPFMRTPPGRAHFRGGAPDGCFVLLEDGRGGVARDNQGRPIIACIGMQYGTLREMQMQIWYSLDRAAKYCLPGHAPGNVTIVTEISPRVKGAPSTFRFPDGNVRSLMKFQHQHFPGTVGATTHFCGMFKPAAWGFRFCRPFMSKEVFESYQLRSSYAHLAGRYAALGSLLPHWGSRRAGEGTFDFDLDRYVEWRAREEGIAAAAICPRGEGRSYKARPIRGLPWQTLALEDEAERGGAGDATADADPDADANAARAVDSPLDSPTMGLGGKGWLAKLKPGKRVALPVLAIIAKITIASRNRRIQNEKTRLD